MKQRKDNANEVLLCLFATTGFLTLSMSGLLTLGMLVLTCTLATMFLLCAVAYTLQEIRSGEQDA